MSSNTSSTGGKKKGSGGSRHESPRRKMKSPPPPTAVSSSDPDNAAAASVEDTSSGKSTKPQQRRRSAGRRGGGSDGARQQRKSSGHRSSSSSSSKPTADTTAAVSGGDNNDATSISEKSHSTTKSSSVAADPFLSATATSLSKDPPPSKSRVSGGGKDNSSTKRNLLGKEPSGELLANTDAFGGAGSGGGSMFGSHAAFAPSSVSRKKEIRSDHRNNNNKSPTKNNNDDGFFGATMFPDTDAPFSPGVNNNNNKKKKKPAAADAPTKGNKASDVFGSDEDLAAFSPAAQQAFAAAPNFDNAAAPVFGGSTNFSDFGHAVGNEDATASGFEAAFDQTPAFQTQSPAAVAPPPQPEWDKSPLTDVPPEKPVPLSLRHRTILTRSFQASPVLNPVNGNLIYAMSVPAVRGQQGGIHLEEVDPKRQFLPVVRVPILSDELRERIATKYKATAIGVDRVVALSAGCVHPQHAAGTKKAAAAARVAVIVDVSVLESSQRLRVVVVWQWTAGGAAGGGKLQYVMTPPSGGDFTYDEATLQVADGLFFLAGSSPKGACVFISRPSVREAWTANFLTGSGTVSALSVRPTHSYLVVGLTDGSVTVWTYKQALVRTSAKSKVSKRWLFPLCRLDTSASVLTVKPEFPGTEGSGSAEDMGHCTQLAWLPQGNTVSSFQLLAVAFENGFAVYHVGLPVMVDASKNGGFQPLPEPTPSTVVSATPLLSPCAVKRWKGSFEASFISWMSFGLHVDPCLAVVLHDAVDPVARTVLCSIDFPTYRKGPAPKIMLLPSRVLVSMDVPKSNRNFPKGMVQSSASNSAICFSESSLSALSLLAGNSSMDLFRSPIASSPPGLTSLGDALLIDSESDKDGILHVFSSILCERQKSELDRSMLKWSLPQRRHWLCRTVVGDTKETTFVGESKEERGFGTNDEEVYGGSSSDVVGDLYHEGLSGMIPVRMVRCLGQSVCAVLYRHALGASDDATLSLDASTIALVNYGDSKSVIEVTSGRDIVLFPCGRTDCTKGLILGTDGSSLTFFEWDRSGSIRLTSKSRPIVGVDTDKDFIACQRVLGFAEGRKLSLAVVGKRLQDDRVCFVTGDVCESGDATAHGWQCLLPNIVSGRSFWLEESEAFLSCSGLQGDGSGYRNYALATSLRVLILNSALTVEAESSDKTSCYSLAPVGSFAVCYGSEDRVRYLCTLDPDIAENAVASLPRTKDCSDTPYLMAVRPDRLLVYARHWGLALIEFGHDADTFHLPAATTRPALFLEPLVANAICLGGKRDESTPILRSIVERFGRKVASIAHGEKEGIGSYGAGLTPTVFSMLNRYGLTHASNWLLSGTVRFERSASTKMLPPWVPIGPKSLAALNSDAMLHVLASGDLYLSDYIKSPSHSMASSLPRLSESTAYLSKEFATNSLSQGRSLDAAKTFDIAGCEPTESLILQVGMMLEKGRKSDASGVLKSLSGYGESGLSRTAERAPSCLAALAMSLKTKNTSSADEIMQKDDIERWIKPLAPSLQRSKMPGRLRQRVLPEEDLKDSKQEQKNSSDAIWASACVESKHVWNEGPRKEKENLLMLDNIQDWLGRKRPVVLGKEGVSAAKDRGELTLADILNQDDEDSFVGNTDDLASVRSSGWVEGIGEGRSDEANLSGYFRMSEGDDEDSPWKSDGLLDLSPYENKALIVGDPSSFRLQESTSSVDEGEPGKVKSLFDLVFDKSGLDTASGLSIRSSRGGSLDIGMLHGPAREARKKCSIEFWYYLPDIQNEQEVVLARRTIGPSGDDMTKACLADYKDCVLWELLLRSTGELEFRSSGGSSILSNKSHDQDDADDEVEEQGRHHIAAFGRWNHICLVMVSKGLDISECEVSMYMRGVEVASMRVSMLPPNFSKEDLSNETKLADVMKKSFLVFGLNHSAGFRMTELRVWACVRSADDTKSLMYEYLTAAEQKKRFKVKIGSKNKKVTTLGKGLGLAAPKTGIAQSKFSRFAPSRGLSGGPEQKGLGFSLAPPPKESNESAEKETETAGKKEGPVSASGFDASFSGFSPFNESEKVPESKSFSAPQTIEEEEGEGEEEEPGENDDVAATLWDTAIPLSQQIRPSAAGALIRGPPATRHYGGNRGGLPDFSGVDRFGVGGIAICGSEKTIVFRDNEDPPALTYPIGASGAIVSDQMDDEGSEFLCCFLAKEGRMVVFELRSRTVVVELQMTTKLNFWRFLPPEAAENTLCFILVTPVGGFHWMPLEESPRPHQVWKRGPELHGKKVVSYEEGGSNGLDGPEILSRVGLVTATRSSGAGTLEGWLVPISGDSKAIHVSDDMLGACLCQPLFVNDGPFLPQLVTVHRIEDETWVNVLTISEPKAGSLAVGKVEATQIIDEDDVEDYDFDAPGLAMGPLPEALCVSLSNIIVVILRRKGLVAAFELEEEGLNLIAQESVDHFVIDAVMRYSAEVGGAEIVMLLSDDENPKDGRIVSFCFRSAE